MPGKLILLAPDDSGDSTGSNVVLLDDLPVGIAPLRPIFEEIEYGQSVSLTGQDDNQEARCARELNSNDTVKPRILFFPSSDTHVKTFAPMIKMCDEPLVMVRRHVQHSEREALEKEGIVYEIHHQQSDMFRQADVVLMGIDWGMEERVFIHHCRRLGLPVACLQESTNVDFEGSPYRMQWADYAMIQGMHATGYLKRQRNFLTGNPRFDSYSPAPEPPQPQVLINCNFTFGLGVDWGRAWVNQVVQAATDLGIPYAITVHPRDETDLSGLDHVMPSSAYKVGDQLAASSILVSRDSSLPYEALLMNRHAVYYNPFHENERCLQEDKSGLIHQCDTPEKLNIILKRLHSQPLPMEMNADTTGAYRFLFTATDGQNQQRVLDALALIAKRHTEWNPQDFRVEPYWKAKWNMTLQQNIRPYLRRIPIAQGLWRMGKRLMGVS